ncbi:MAG: porin [Phenylobacterium sp.]
MKLDWMAVGLAAVGFVAAGPACADETVEFSESGLTVNGPGDFRVNVGGRIHIDTAAFDDEITQFDDDTQARRIRLETAVRFTDQLSARVDYDFVPGNEGWRNVWVQWRFNDDFALRGGNQIVPYSMEDMASSNGLTFMERSLQNGLAPGYGMAAVLQARGERWTAHLGYFEEAIGDEDDQDQVDNDESGAAARVTFTPIRDDDQLLHLGAAVLRRELPDGAPFRLRLRPEAGLADNRLIDTGALAGAEQFDAYNLEAAYLRGPFSVQAEFSRLDLDRSNRPDPTFQAGYVQVSYVLTGERRDYSRSTGVLGGVDVRRDHMAFELAARYSVADLDSETVSGGTERNWTLGANWYLNRNIRLMANYVHADADPNRNGVEESLNIWQGRLQFAF